jgi:pimeloyl-ACP methyl ester carboxylesterase
MKRFFVDTVNGQMHYRAAGSGEALILLHEVPLSSSEFCEVMPLLSRGYFVIAPDLPSYGDTYKYPGTPGVEDLAKAVVEFMDILHIKKAHVAGHHAGAAVAVEIAAVYPERVNKVVLSACTSLSREQGRMWLQKTEYKSLDFTPDGWFLDHVWRYVLQRIPEGHPDRMSIAYRCMLDYMKAGDRSEEMHQAIFRYDIYPKLDKVKQQALAMCGDEDRMFPVHEATLQHIPHAKNVTLPGASGWAPLLIPDRWGQPAYDFLAGDA